MKKSRGWWLGLATVVGVTGLLIACGEQISNPSIQPNEGVLEEAGPFLRSAAGLEVADQRMRSLLGGITREVAIALRDPDLRVEVYQQLRLSPYRENKLHFRTALTSNLSDLLTGVARASEVGESAVLAKLDSLIDLEFYMPVPEHREKWAGGENLIVASALRDDGTVPVAFDLGGREVRLASAEEPPTTPALVLVPVETDFSNRSRSGAYVLPPGAAPWSEPAGIYMTYANVEDDHEGWFMGSPEFEVHLSVRESGSNIYSYTACAGAKQYDPRKYDHNNQTWYGRVLVALESEIAQAYLGKFSLQMWEDDSEYCADWAGSGKPPKADQVYVDDINDFDVRRWGFYHDTLFTGMISTFVDFFEGAFTHKDDFVGFMELPGSGNGCWPASGPVSVSLFNSDHTHEGYATLDITFDHTRDPICPTSPPPPLSVVISGPSTWTAYQVVTVQALPSYGSSPITYEWQVNGSPKCGNQNWCSHAMGPPYSSVYFWVRVTDGDREVATNSHIVTATSGW